MSATAVSDPPVTQKPSQPAFKDSSTKVKPKSRAVVRDVEAGSDVDCVYCSERVKFQAKLRNKQVICNVYVKRTWNRVEHYHPDCYEAVGSPHGAAEAGIDYRRAAANADSTKPKRPSRKSGPRRAR